MSENKLAKLSKLLRSPTQVSDENRGGGRERKTREYQVLESVLLRNAREVLDHYCNT